MSRGRRSTNGLPKTVPAGRGVTLIELLLVITLVGVLTAVATWGSRQLMQGWQLKRGGQQLLGDLKALQGQAEMAGSLALANGGLVMQRTFLVFDTAAHEYSAHGWRDDNADGSAQADETRQLWRKSLPAGVVFGWSPGIDRRACSNSAGPPGSAVSFASPAYAPCAGRPCIKFDRHGFSVMGPGAAYLRAGERSLAISGTRPGHFTLCEWDGERWH